MKRLAIFLALALALGVGLVATTAGCGGAASAETSNKSGGAAASISGDISVYTALEDDQIQAYLVSFKQQYPNIKVNIVRDSTGVITSKLLAEKDNPVADVAWGIAATSLLVLDQNKQLEAYSPKGVDRVQASFKDKSSTPTWVGIDSWMTAFTVNTDECKKRNIPVPQSYQDLLNPIYKGLIVMPDPNASGTGFLTVSGWLQHYGQQAGWDYMKKLDQNVAYYVDSGSKPATLASTGECVIGISFDYRGIQLKEQGAPVDVVFPTEGSGWDVEANALIKKATIKPAAKAFLDWAISDAPMAAYAKNYPITAVKLNTTIPTGYPSDPVKQLLTNDLYWAASNRASILQQWTTFFGSKDQVTTTTAKP